MMEDDILNPLILLEGDSILDGLNLSLEDCDYDENYIFPLRDMIVSEYKNEIRLLRKRADYDVSMDKEIARKYIGWFGLLKRADDKKDLESLEARFLEAKDKLDFNLESLADKLDNYKDRLKSVKKTLVQKQYKEGEKGVLELHYDEVSVTDRLGQAVKGKLKAATTDELKRKYKLSEKSMGWQYLILLGEDRVDLKGNTRKDSR